MTARKNRNRAGRTLDGEVEAVLAGRKDVTARRLVELIHAVNPTGRIAAPAETERRYETKSRLQSLLVRRWGEELDVVPDRQDPDVVLLRHRFSGFPATHAPIDALDEDARSWIRFQLDAGLAPREPAPRPGDDATRPRPASQAQIARAAQCDERGGESLPDTDAADLLRLGREAAEEFDYPRARDLLTEALRASAGGADAALALLELLVEQLGMDDAALDAGAELSPRAAADPVVRGLLAVAAARCGQAEVALEWSAGAEAARASDAFLQLAGQAVKRGDAEEAEALAARVREREGGHTKLLELSARIDRLRADLRAPLEGELARSLAQGDFDAAERQARSILGRFPDSAGARRALRKIEEHHRDRQAGELAGLAAGALAAGELGRATELLRQAGALGRPAGELDRRLREALEAERRRTEEQEVALVASLIEAPDPVPGLERYLALDEPLRARVRQNTSSPLPGWLDEMGPSGRSRARAAIDAALALRAAGAALELGDAAAALAMLAGHERTLERVRRAGEVADEAGRLEMQRRRGEAERALAGADAALARADVPGARTGLDAVDRGALDADGRSRRDALDRRLRQRADIDERRRRLDEAVASCDFLRARIEAEGLASVAEAPDRGGWLVRAEELDGEVRRVWRLRTHEWEEAEGPPATNWAPDIAADLADARYWLTADGAAMVVVTVHDRWLFVRFVGVADGKLRGLARLRTPEPLRRPQACVEGDRVWVLGEAGGVVALSLGRRKLDRWLPLDGAILPDEEIFDPVFVPEADALWIHTVPYASRMHAPPRTVLVDLGDGKIRRESEGPSRSLFRLWSPEGVRVGLAGDERGCTAIHPRGGAAGGINFPDEMQFRAIVPHPGGRGWLAATARPNRDGVLDGRPFDLVEMAPDGSVSARQSIERSIDWRAHELATSLASGHSFVLYDGQVGPELVGLRPSPDGLERAFELAAPGGTMLVSEAGSRYAAVVVAADELRVWALAGSPPELVGKPACSLRLLPEFDDLTLCEARGGRRADQLALHALLGKLPLDERPGWVGRFHERETDDPLALYNLGVALDDLGARELAAQTFRVGAERFDPHPLYALLRVGEDVGKRDWRKVREDLQTAGNRDLSGRAGSHYHHLLGLACLRLGDAEAARRAWLAGLEFVDPEDPPGDGCRLPAYLPLAGAMPGGRFAEDPGALLVYELVQAMRDADEGLAASRPDAVCRRLECPRFVQCDELQTLARLAEAHLRLEPAAEPDIFRKARALAQFSALHDAPRKAMEAVNLPVPDVSWPPERLADVARRARQWLGEDEELALPPDPAVRF